MEAVRVFVGSTDDGLEIRFGRNLLASDAVTEARGQTVGIGPEELLLASLGSCTSSTLRSYAKQRGWAMQALDIDLRLDRHGTTSSIERILAISGTFDERQREQIFEAAEHTPVTLLLKSGLRIRTEPA